MNASEQHTIERFYAYTVARSRIQCYCKLLGYGANQKLEWDTGWRIDGDEEVLQRDIDQAVAYLDSRNLLLRPHPGAPSIVVILPNDEERRERVAA